MSDTDANEQAFRNKAKRRRLPGACDYCKKKKTRCDGAQQQDGLCTNCMDVGIECTHHRLVNNMGSAKSYVKTLEQRLERMTLLLNELMPGMDVERELERQFPISSATVKSPNPSPFPQLRNDDDSATDGLTIKLNALQVDPSSRRYEGKSSHLYLVQNILNQHSFMANKEESKGLVGVTLKDWKRPEYWEPDTWQLTWLQRRRIDYIFPPEDLILDLVQLYFDIVNVSIPVLHEATFQAAVAEGLHWTDQTFGGLLLLVCALGSRFSKDLRVCIQPNDPNRRSAGWHYFEQVEVVHTSFYERPTLYEVQSYVLCSMYEAAVLMAAGSRVQVSLGLRLAQDVGAHRKKVTENATIEDELWKRTYWALVAFDVSKSSATGIPCTVRREDHDLDYPVEYPGDKPHAIQGFVLFLKLIDIQIEAMHRTYSIRRSPLVPGGSVISDEQMISGLDSALNEWLAAVPDDLRWDSDNPPEDPWPSVYLFSSYYNLQIFIHRPFIPTVTFQSPKSYVSLAICTNAARAIARIIGHPAVTATPNRPLWMSLSAAFTSGMVLLMGSWSGKRQGLVYNSGPDMEHIRACLAFLKAAEGTWGSAGRLWDILSHLVASGDLPSGGSSYGIKRTLNNRDDAREIDATQDTPPPGSTVTGNQQYPPDTGNTTIFNRVASHPLLQNVVHSPFNIGQDAFASQNMHQWHMDTTLTPEQNLLASLYPGLEFDGAIPVSGNVRPLGYPPVEMLNAVSMWNHVPSGYEIDDWGPHTNAWPQVVENSTMHIPDQFSQ